MDSEDTMQDGVVLNARREMKRGIITDDNFNNLYSFYSGRDFFSNTYRMDYFKEK
ncbi:hypothetical protein CCP1ISM_60040 [Azospirillaceae bacterium]